jgi:Domain of unknown function (DUF4136)
MIMKIRIALCTTFICVLSAIALAQTYVDYNHNIDFTKFKTYAWGQGANPNAINNSIMAQSAQQAVDSQLAAKGLQKVEESQHPDLIVVTSSGMKQQTSYNAWGTGGWRWGGGMAEVTPETTNVGTLVVDIYDANGKQMIWRGIAKDTLSNKSEKNEKEMNKAVEKMFKQYP